jgi:hypothetical protein
MILMAFFTRVFKWLAIIFVSLYLIIWSLSSPITKYFLAPLLAEQGLRLSDETSIRFNPFLTRLSINNLGLLDSKTQKNSLKIKKLILQLALHQLVFKQVSIQKFIVDDFYIQVETSKNHTTIAGFVIDNSKDKATKSITTNASTENEYQLTIPKLQLSHGDISVDLAGQNHHLNIENLILRDTAVSTQNIASTLILIAKIDQAKTLLSAELVQKNKQINITSQLSISHFSLINLPQLLLHKYPEIKKLTGLVSVNSESLITLDDKDINIAAAKTTLMPENIVLSLKNKDKDWQINIADIHSQLTDFVLTLPQKNKEKVQFSFEKFSLSMNKPSLFIDHSFKESIKTDIKRSIQIKSLTVGALSNNNTKVETPFQLLLMSNEYASLMVKGSLIPFAKVPKYNIDAKLKELSLPSLAPYIEKAAGFSIQSGQLDNSLTLSLTGDKIVGNTKILIKGLETSSVDEDNINLLSGATTMPLNMALNTLKDDRGNVELDVPLSGSTHDPHFGLNSLLTLITKKAVFSATKTYAIKTFLPYANVISVALTAGDFLFKVRFADLPYQAKQIKPNKNQQPYLLNFIKLMDKSKTLNVKICAIAVRKDLDDNMQHLSRKAVSKYLKKLAEKRELAFKAYILAHSKIDSSRLLLCAPQIDLSVKAKPRIEISI